MKSKNSKIVLIQSLLVLTMGAATAYLMYFHIGLWTLAVFFGLELIGMLVLFSPKAGVLLFSLINIACSSIAIISHNSIDLAGPSFRHGSEIWVKIWEPTDTVTSFPDVLIVGILLISGYVALSIFSNLDLEYRRMNKDGTDIIDIQNMIRLNIRAITLLLVSGIAVSVLFVIILVVTQTALGQYVTDTWSIPVFMTPALLILGGFIYWIVTRNLPQRKI